jgi:hypothetical protein
MGVDPKIVDCGSLLRSLAFTEGKPAKMPPLARMSA